MRGYEGQLESDVSDTGNREPHRQHGCPTISCAAVSRRSAAAGSARAAGADPRFPRAPTANTTRQRRLRDAGAMPEILVIRNLTSDAVAASVGSVCRANLAQSQIVFIPGGFSGGDEPDGSGKFITAFFRNAAISGTRSPNCSNSGTGLMCGICNGFQALIKLGPGPLRKDRRTRTQNCPTLTYNNIGRHQSTIVCTAQSPPISLRGWRRRRSGRSTTSPSRTARVASSRRGAGARPPGRENGQIATQYVDLAVDTQRMDIRLQPEWLAP